MGFKGESEREDRKIDYINICASESELLTCPLKVGVQEGNHCPNVRNVGIEIV